MSLFKRYLLTAALGLFVLGAVFELGGFWADRRSAGPVSVRAFGAKGDGETDDTAAIQRAIDFAAERGRLVVFPGGTYCVKPAAILPDEAGRNAVCLQMRSHMHLQGQGGAAVKLADGQSTDAAPRCIALFFSNERLRDISFRDLTLDMNGKKNPISPRRSEGKYSLFTQAHILFSGGSGAGANDVVVERCTFLNTPGVTCIGMAQTNKRGAPLGRKWRIRDCVFHNNGLDTNDHSSIYAWAEDVECSGCTFSSDQMVTADGVGPLVAYEVHGRNQRFTNNAVSNYYQGLWVATNGTSPTRNVIVADNVFSPLRGVGVDFYRKNMGEPDICEVTIRENVFDINDDPVKAELKAAVQIASDLAVRQVRIVGNRGQKTGSTHGSTFVGITTQAVPGQEHDEITISDNRASGFVCGVWLASGRGAGLGSVAITNNSFFDLAPSNKFVHAMGINVVLRHPNTAIARLSVIGNEIGALHNVANTHYGMFLSGTIRSLHISRQRYAGITLKEVEDAALVVEERTP